MLAIGHKLLPPMQRHISRCSREVETGNAPDPLQENRVAFQTVVWGMVSKQVMIVGSGMVRIDDRGRNLRRDIGRGLGRIDGEGGGQRPRPLAIATEAIPTRHDAELLLGGLEGLRVGDALPLAEQPRRSGTYKRKDLLI
jgi:hypothetical protein